jgi:hypothetical protein
MYSVPSDELSATLETKWANDFKVIPPKSSGKNGIMTGSMMYVRKLENGRIIGDQIAFMGPPCTMLPPIRDGRVLYPKISLNLNREDGKTDENDPKDEAYAKERDAFVDFVREMEAQTLKKVKENPTAYFGGKVTSADNVFIKNSLVEAEEDNYRTKLACKVGIVIGKLLGLVTTNHCVHRHDGGRVHNLIEKYRQAINDWVRRILL